MKITVLILSILGVLCFQNSNSKVTWNTKEYDFGVIEYQEPITTTFVFTNVTEDSIKLDNVRTSCGCTSPMWSNKYVMPGDTSHIVIEYDAHDYGEFYKEIKVFIRKQRKPDKLYVTGEVR